MSHKFATTPFPAGRCTVLTMTRLLRPLVSLGLPVALALAAPVLASSGAREVGGGGAPGAPVPSQETEDELTLTSANPGWIDVVAPAGVDFPAAQFIELDAPAGRKILAGVFRPAGDGPFPTVVVLHGGAGFVQPFLALAEDLAAGGFLAIAGCWFQGQPSGPTSNYIDCPRGPQFKFATVQALPDVAALVDTARSLPEASADRVGLFGFSRGANMAVLAASNDGGIQAVVAASVAPAIPGRPDTRLVPLADRLDAPILMLQSTADEVVDIEDAREYDSALRAAGRQVESHYYDDAPHAILSYPTTSADVRRRAIEFLTTHLAP